MADKDFKVKTGIDLPSPLPASEGGTGQTSLSNALNAMLPSQAGNAAKVLQTDGTNTTWVTLPNGYQKGNTASRPGSPSIGDIYSNTETGYIEVYTAAGWSQLGVIPLTPTIGTATDVGTNRAFNNAAVSVAFTPNIGGGLASSFTATSTSGGYSGSGSSSPVIVSGIPSNTSLTFTVTATNGYGNSLASTASNSATATTVPQTPTIGTPTNVTGVAFGSTCSASVPVTANATGGKSITGFTVTSSPGGLTGTGSSPITVAGLSSGTSYTFTAVASNDNGNSTATTASSSLTPSTVPQAPTIGTISVTNSTTLSVPFTAGSNGNSSITSYVATSSPSVALSVSGTTSPLAVTGTFTANTAYTIQIAAVNANGTGLYSTSSNSVTPIAATSSVDYLVVAGGGGGWNSGGGGAGAGGMRTGALSVSPGTSYTVTVGAGGVAGVVNGVYASRGSNSVFSSITSTGGGTGQFRTVDPVNGSGSYVPASGGSGGGGGGAGSTTRGLGTAGQGNNGGFNNSGSYNGTGGGGGAGAVGTDSASGAHGGNGSASSITGSSVTYAGGGGGELVSASTTTRANGGSGGGGLGGNTTNNSPSAYPATAGAANTGGGGGSCSSNVTDGIAAPGGSGIVVIAYPNNFRAATLSGLTFDQPSRSGYRVYRITGGSGTITF